MDVHDGREGGRIGRFGFLSRRVYDVSSHNLQSFAELMITKSFELSNVVLLLCFNENGSKREKSLMRWLDDLNPELTALPSTLRRITCR